MSSFKSLKKIMDESNSYSQDVLDRIDFTFQEIVMLNDDDLKPSLELMENFLLNTLEEGKNDLEPAA